MLLNDFHITLYPYRSGGNLNSALGSIFILSMIGLSIPNAKDVTYTVSSENFANPERGFFRQSSGKDRVPSTQDMIDDRKYDGISLQRQIFRLDDFRNSALPTEYLDRLSKYFKSVRDAGCKSIPRFAYNYERNDDAPKTIILGHIDQLKKVLTDNADVIAFVEVGFIGQWGEWHDSSNKLDNREAQNTLKMDNVGPGAEILERLLSALPKERMVALRYNLDKRQIFKSDLPLSPAEAYTGTSRSRTGNHNDCFLAPNADNGTYGYGEWGPGLAASIDKEKTFLNQDNRYVPQGGETCQVSEYSGCASALIELKRMRWDALNEGFSQSVLGSWSSGGCMETIKRSLGYRFQLNKATVQDSARPGNVWGMNFSIVNTGFGKAYNPRAIEIVFRQVNGKAKYRFQVSANPRLWLTDEPANVTVSAGIPKDMPEGEYKVFLNLPDPTLSLRNRPQYSIRLANNGLWEDSTGFNYLGTNVFIKATARIQPLVGNGILTPWEADWVGILDHSTRRQGFAKKNEMPGTLISTQKGWIDIQGRTQGEAALKPKILK